MNQEDFKKENRYDEYVEYYNGAGQNKSDHIPVLAELAKIEERVKKRVDEIRVALNGSLHETEEDLDTYIDEFKSSNKEQDKEIQELRDEIVLNIRWLIKNPHSQEDGIEIQSLRSSIEKLFKILGLKEQGKVALFLYEMFTELLCNYRVVTNHFQALQLLNNKIIHNNYPLRLDYYKDLPEDEKKDIKTRANKVGAPLRKEVPQDKVREIVQRIISRFEKGQIIRAKVRGETRAFSIVHQGGSREGKANINQIFKYFKASHPDLINLSSRQFKERIKKAVPEKMK